MKYSILLLSAVLLYCSAHAQRGVNAFSDSIWLKRPLVSPSGYNTFVGNNTLSIPQNYYTLGLGFFCRQELRMQQVHVPVTFRLGSMEDCNRLEQKPGYR